MFNSKTWIVFSREFSERIKSKAFIISTLLVPVAMVAMMGITAVGGYFASKSDDADRPIALVDHTEVIGEELVNISSLNLEHSSLPEDSLRARVNREELKAYIVIDKEIVEGQGDVTYFSKEGASVSLIPRLGSAVNKVVRRNRMMTAGASEQIVELGQADTSIKTVKVSEEGDSADWSFLSAGIGYFAGFVMYMSILLYGSLVFRGVIEEKSSRIMEVVISSIKPFNLMLGKILGIGAVSLVQLMIWTSFMIGMSAVAGPIAASFIDPGALELADSASQEEVLASINDLMPEFPYRLVIFLPFFYLFGFLLFASFYAAIGAASEQESDAQTLSIPLVIPVIAAFMLVTPVVASPDSTLAVVTSILPFISPILMPARMGATVVPFWQIGLSLLVLLLSFLLAVKVCAKIYRVGVLMYGKKASFKDLIKWMKYA